MVTNTTRHMAKLKWLTKAHTGQIISDTKTRLVNKLVIDAIVILLRFSQN